MFFLVNLVSGTYFSKHPAQRARTIPVRDATTTKAPPTTAPAPPQPLGAGLRVMTFVDTTRLIYPPHTANGQPSPRVLQTYIWYPATGIPLAGNTVNAAPAVSRGPFPLVIFCPGYDLYPTSYASLLRTWVRAGYVVASPVFPLTNPGTPGGPDEEDIVNQPEDVEFIINQLLAQNASASSPIHALINPSSIAVTGHSDGGDTALVVAYDTCCRDPQVKAAVIMAGQELNMPAGGSYYPAGSPPLLAIQGTADTVNVPADTYQLFDQAPQPKYLLTLPGADHLIPFTQPGPYESAVEKVSIDFLNTYLKGTNQLTKMATDGNVAGIATLTG